MLELSTKIRIAGLIIAIGLSTLILDLYFTLQNPLNLKDSILISLEKGSSIKSLAKDLHAKGVLDKPNYLIVWARLTGSATKLKAGEYRVDSSDNLTSVINKIISGKVEQYKLTLVEGWTFKEILSAINDHPQVQHTIANDSISNIINQLGIDIEHPEGRFYPDTYFIPKNTNDIDVLKKAFNTMNSILDSEWSKREEGLPFKSAYEALILASIVEKESAVADERSKIAGVFINRLRNKMRLQTDPAVIYGIGDAYDGDIRYKDLRNDTPYNTYTRGGLPPTPIASPGLASIKAVLHPDKTDALYFVAFGDNSGRHHFSSNLSDHEKAVSRYQKHKLKAL